MEIRRLAETDWQAYRAIRLEALQDSPEAFGTAFEEQKDLPPEYWSSRLADGEDSFVLGAFADEKIIATAGLIRERRQKTRHKGSIVGVYVTPAFRGRGIAKALVGEIVSLARSLPGVEQLTLAVVTEKVAARGLYEKLGFKVFGTELRALKVGDRYVDEEHMFLFL